MLPIKLEIENINSFTARQTVDFTAVSGDGIFCIAGETGAGKTTVLDSMIIALYGMGVSGKSNGGDRAGKDDYINVNADKASVSFTFSMDGKTYTAERSFTRGGVHTAYLYCDGQLVCRGAGAVSEEIERLIGLEKEQFTQVIVLEQGKFSKFLNAGHSARVKTVMKLFGLERFDLFSRVNKYYTDLKARTDVYRGKLEEYRDDTDKALKELKSLCVSESKKAEQIAAELNAMREELSAGRAKLAAYETYSEALRVAEELAKRREAAAAALAAAENVDGAVLSAAAEAAAERAREAALKKEKVEAAAEDVARYAEAKKAVEAARSDYVAVRGERNEAIEERDKAASAARETGERLSGLTAELEKYSRILQRLSGITAAAENTTATENTAAAAAMNTAAQLALAEARRRASDRAKADAEIRQAEKELAGLAADKAKSEAAYVETKRVAEQAAADYESAQRSNAKAFITQGLSAGDRCPLCGGTLSEIPSAADVDGPKERERAAQAALRAAEAAIASLCERIAGVNKRIEGRAVPEELPAALEEYERAAELAAEAAACAEKLAAAEKLTAEMKAKADNLTEKLSGKESEGKAAKERLETYRRNVERALGAFAEGREYEDAAKAAEKAAEAAAAEAAAADKKVKARESEIKRLAADKAAADGAYGQAVAALKPAPAADKAAVEALKLKAEAKEAELAELRQRIGGLNEKINGMASRIADKRAIEAGYRSLSERFDTAGQLIKALRKDKNGAQLIDFVAEEYIREFTAEASSRLNGLTGGKYTLEYTDGDFYIRDFLNGNQPRRTQTLSGGETFLASLALAVAIAGIISADRTYGFFFLDEGFGTLDEGRIAGVSEALRNLSRDTLVGVVTHSESLMELIPAHIDVIAATDSSGSRIA